MEKRMRSLIPALALTLVGLASPAPAGVELNEIINENSSSVWIEPCAYGWGGNNIEIGKPVQRGQVLTVFCLALLRGYLMGAESKGRWCSEGVPITRLSLQVFMNIASRPELMTLPLREALPFVLYETFPCR
ncbi:MAG: hypothetical protein FJX42_04830 [Alphaproteobacteria bacterium]|nr:hypothetical protein [Alphaproteobacteria bacterium]